MFNGSFNSISVSLSTSSSEQNTIFACSVTGKKWFLVEKKKMHVAQFFNWIFLTYLKSKQQIILWEKFNYYHLFRMSPASFVHYYIFTIGLLCEWDPSSVYIKIYALGSWMVRELTLVKYLLLVYKWATTWRIQQNECVPSKDSDQPGHPPSLIRVFAVRSVGS